MKPERQNCPMRHQENGNCTVIGGFCVDAVSDEICEALHNAYESGWYDALLTKREAEKNEPLTREELLKMDGQPVWIEFVPEPDGEQIKIWALVSVDAEDDEIFMRNSLGGSSAYEEVSSDIRAIYRRPPKEATDV